MELAPKTQILEKNTRTHLLVNDTHSYKEQNKRRFEYTFRGNIEASSSVAVLWFTLTYSPDKARTSYSDALSHNIGNIHSYCPKFYNDLFAKYVLMDSQERLRFIADYETTVQKTKSAYKYVVPSFGMLAEKKKYFLSALGLLPFKEKHCSFITGRGLQKATPLFMRDARYYGDFSDYENVFRETYSTRTGKVIFDHRSLGYFTYTEDQFNNIKRDAKKEWSKFHPSYKWTPSDDTLLCREDIQNFFSQLQKECREYCDVHGLGIYNKCRYMYAGEYGSATHRAHNHVLIFVPTELADFLTKGFMLDFCKKNWSFGHVSEIDYYDETTMDTDKITSYLCKHFVKFDKGNYWQQKMAPIYAYSSCYDGGIGFQLIDPRFDTYSNEIATELHKMHGEKSPLVTDVGGYNHSLPRFYRRKMFPEYKFSKEKLSEMSKNSYLETYAPMFQELQIDVPVLEDYSRENVIRYIISCIQSQDNISDIDLDLYWDDLYTSTKNFVESYENAILAKDDFARDSAIKNYYAKKHIFKDARYAIYAQQYQD